MSRVLGVDYGSKRIGLAISDPLRLTAHPLEVVSRSDVIERMGELCDEYGFEEVVMGLPTGLSGGEGVSAAGARQLAAEMEDELGIHVVWVDERFTSRMAETALLESGMKRRQRKSTVDKVAAAIILQAYLDAPNGNSPDGRDVE